MKILSSSKQNKCTAAVFLFSPCEFNINFKERKNSVLSVNELLFHLSCLVPKGPQKHVGPFKRTKPHV